MKEMRNEKGFTLIEIVMVIVLLGILAAVAIPRFLDLGTEARTAAVEGMSGGLAGAMAITRAGCLTDSTCDETAATDTTTVGGAAIDVVYGYPAATAAGITAAMTYVAGQFTAAYGATATYTIQANCLVTYTPAPDAANAATVGTTTTGC